ncbi:Tryptophan--tRNA ligase, cytoplasmic [Dichanthelium oligosanthes]|uniref:tryptophan--tRNA ligase n=1 Tax=Dichanthelium oligosanthes TaxID=888268 RepID=A0A1E5VXL2_9POAL|nr:Tryptophan--tRNA ligase, cytoplasmic [Dichanthelium oligosanthes]
MATARDPVLIVNEGGGGGDGGAGCDPAGGVGGEGGLNYDKLVDQFGCQRIDAALVARVARLTSRPPHRFLRRGIFFAHRDFNVILDLYERGKKFYLYTGRGPSSEALHLGHLVPFMFRKYLQDAFQVPLVIQLTDDEKFLWKNLTIAETKRLSPENAKDIIAYGFDIERTFIFSDFNYIGGTFYENMAEVSRRVSYNKDPYFRMTRDVSQGIGYEKPSLIESRFFPALQGDNMKMSASDPNSAIYVTDSVTEITDKVCYELLLYGKKVKKYAFSGGQESMVLHRNHGANLGIRLFLRVAYSFGNLLFLDNAFHVDVSIKYLNFFLEDDDELEHIKKEYKEGRMGTGKVNQRLVTVLSELVKRHQRARAQVTEEMVDAFMAARPNMFGFG